MHYYYLIASLPLLKFGEGLPFPLSHFINRCRQEVTEHHFSELNHLISGNYSKSNNHYIKHWGKITSALRNASAVLRAKKLGKQIDLDIRLMEHADQELYQRVAKVFENLNPLTREIALDRLRWDLVKSVFAGDQFAFTAIMSYGLKMQILDRWQSISTEAGEKQLAKILGNAVSQYSD